MNDRGAGWRPNADGEDYARWEAGRTPQDQRAFAVQREYGDERREYPGSNRGGYYGRRLRDDSMVGLDQGRGFGNRPNWGNQGRMGRGGWEDDRDWGPETRPEYGYPRGIGEGFGFYGRPGIGSQAYDQGPHAGKGPRGYRRSDDRIREEICDRLTQHGWMDASELEVEVQNGEVTLRGEVDDRRQKRLAEEIAEEVSGVHDVQNRLRVHDHGQAMQGEMDRQATGDGKTAQMGQRAGPENQTADTRNNQATANR